MADMRVSMILNLVDRMTAPLRGVIAGVQGLGSRTAALGERLQGLAMPGLAAGAAGAGIIAALRAPVDAAVNFEAAMARVGKVVDFPTPTGLGDLSQQLLAMSRGIPVAATGLAEIAAAAGQFGIASDKILQFTRLVAQMSTAFDMPAADAGEAAAKLMNQYKLSIETLGQLGDVVNHLANNTAAKERDIIQALGRVAGTAQQFGLAASQTAALADALLALGRPPEIAATGINALLTKLGTADKQGRKFQEALRAMGLSATDLKTAIGRDAQGALTDFLGRLERIDRGQRMGLLVDLFGLEYADDIGTLVEGLDSYRQALNLLGADAKISGAMGREFAAMSATTASQLTLLGNVGREAGIAFGTLFLPPIVKAVKWLRDLGVSATGWVKDNEKLAEAVGLGIAAFGGFLAVVGAVSLGLAGLGTAIGLVMSPLALIVGALGAMGYLVWRNWEAWGPPLKRWWDGVSRAAADSWQWLQQQADRYWPAIRRTVDQATTGLGKFADGAWTGLLEGLSRFDGFGANTQQLFDALAQKMPGTNALWRDMGQFLGPVADRLRDIRELIAELTPGFGSLETAGLRFGHAISDSFMALTQPIRALINAWDALRRNFGIGPGQLGGGSPPPPGPNPHPDLHPPIAGEPDISRYPLTGTAKSQVDINLKLPPGVTADVQTRSGDLGHNVTVNRGIAVPEWGLAP